MSETTKRTSHLTPFYLPSPDMADSAEKDLWMRLYRDVPPRPSTLAAEGGAERETTNSPAEIGSGCTGLEAHLSDALAYGMVVALVSHEGNIAHIPAEVWGMDWGHDSGGEGF